MQYIEIMKSDSYKKILKTSLEYGEHIIFTDKFPKKKLDFLKKNVISNSFDDTYFFELEVYKLTEFCLQIDGRYIGIFDNKYIVSFYEGDLYFKFIGDTISNWFVNFSSPHYRDSENKIQNLCYEQFGIPIRYFDADEFHYNLKPAILFDLRK